MVKAEKWIVRYAVAAAVMLASIWGSVPVARAQMQQGDEPATAMGAGRMVRGTVTATAPQKLTVKTEAGEVYQVALTPNTQVRKGRDPLKPTDIHVGDGVGAMGELDRPNKTVHAMFVAVMDAEQIKKAREAMGKTMIAGKITAIDEVKLTVMRSDNVSQVIQVDEDTSFKRGGRGMQIFNEQRAGAELPTGAAPGSGGPAGQPGAAGESITLADVKVGDTVAGTGALKNGVFVPKDLAVFDPATARRGRRGGGEGAGASQGQPAGRPQ